MLTEVVALNMYLSKRGIKPSNIPLASIVMQSVLVGSIVCIIGAGPMALEFTPVVLISACFTVLLGFGYLLISALQICKKISLPIAAGIMAVQTGIIILSVEHIDDLATAGFSYLMWGLAVFGYGALRWINQTIFNATHDSMTGLNNREFMIRHFDLQKTRGRRNGEHAIFLIIDIDNFKQVNDNFGHLFGDQVIQQVAQSIQSCLREGDVAARTGGEEFDVLLANCDEYNAKRICNRINNKVNAERPEKLPVLSVSIGICNVETEKDYSETRDCADRALYRAKQLGKARTEVAAPSQT